jgi:hypothetical protein
LPIFAITNLRPQSLAFCKVRADKDFLRKHREKKLDRDVLNVVEFTDSYEVLATPDGVSKLTSQYAVEVHYPLKPEDGKIRVHGAIAAKKQCQEAFLKRGWGCGAEIGKMYEAYLKSEGE